MKQNPFSPPKHTYSQHAAVCTIMVTGGVGWTNGSETGFLLDTSSQGTKLQIHKHPPQKPFMFSSLPRLVHKLYKINNLKYNS
jgi:hypothetical protein